MGTQTTFVNIGALSSAGAESGLPSARLGASSGITDVSWSGVMIRAAGTGIVSVSAQWTVPNFTRSSASASNCLIWVGLDGKDESNDVLQAGVGCDFNGATRNVYAWYEWYKDPLQPVPQSDLQVSIGDIIQCSIKGTISSGTATIEFKNLSPGAVPDNKSITVNAKSGQLLTGNCAEWVVEAKQKGYDPMALCNYGMVQFSKCAAQDANRNPFDPNDASYATAFNLQQRGKIVSYGSSPGPGQVVCSQNVAMGTVPNTIAKRALPGPNTLGQPVS
jgi:Peptidase A4 family